MNWILHVFVLAALSFRMIQVSTCEQLNFIYDITYDTSKFSNMFPSRKETYQEDFICEIPESNSGKNSKGIKLCNYRGRLFPEDVYKWYTGHGCYVFSQPALFNLNVPNAVIQSCYYSVWMTWVPCFVLQKSDGFACYPIDYEYPEIIGEIERTMIHKMAAEKWTRCSKAAMDCCVNVMNDENVKPNQDNCTAVWDGWSCWEPACLGNVSSKVCPEFAYSNQGPSCNHYSSKTCFENATWITTTDYSTCSVNSRLLQRTDVHISLLIVTIVFGTPAVIIMLAYKRLRIHRLALHRNILIAIIIRSLLVIITKSVIIHDELTNSNETIMERNQIPCKILAVLEKTAASSVFTCMLIDGLFMHKRIVSVFKKEYHITTVYSLASVATIIPVIVWTALMIVYNDSNCWIVYTMPGLQWILDVPRILTLSVNLLMLINILRVIITSLNSEDNAQQLSTTKTMMFLVPLFGVQFLLTAWRPAVSSCDWEQAYYYFTFVVESLQGIAVAALYCYANKEVHRLIKQTYNKTETVVSTHFRNNKNRRATKTEPRRCTMSTVVLNDNAQRQSPDNNNNLSPDLLDYSSDNANWDNINLTPDNNEISNPVAYENGYVMMDFEYDNHEILSSKL